MSNNTDDRSFEEYFNSFEVENSNPFSNTTNSSNTDTSSNPFGNIDIGTIMKLKGMMDKMNVKKDDPRANLLRSLKPYMRESRKDKIDQYIQLFGMTQLMEGFSSMNSNSSIFNFKNGGDTKK